jgi:hypothetical protein
MSYYLENKLSEIIGQPVGCVSITRSGGSSHWYPTGYLHGQITAIIRFSCKTKVYKESFGSLRIFNKHETEDYEYLAQLFYGKETDELFFACAKDFLPNLKEPK